MLYSMTLNALKYIHYSKLFSQCDSVLQRIYLLHIYYTFTVIAILTLKVFRLSKCILCVFWFFFYLHYSFPFWYRWFGDNHIFVILYFSISSVLLDIIWNMLKNIEYQCVNTSICLSRNLKPFIALKFICYDCEISKTWNGCVYLRSLILEKLSK